MNFRQITPFMILIIFIGVLLQVGCDTLVTESNTTIVFDSTLGIRCFDCHADDDNMLLRPRGQFENSAHANNSLLDVVDVSCTNCHTHEGFLKTSDKQIISHNAYSAINCFTCHVPHPEIYGEWNMKDLRASGTANSTNFINGLGADLKQSNTCAHCHKAVATVDVGNEVILTENFGPHISPQADITSGRNGFFYDVESEDQKTSKHFDNGCIKCHYGSFGSGQGYTFAEHTFRLEDKNSLQQYTKTCNATCHKGTAATYATNPPPVTDFYDSPMIIEIDSIVDSVKSLLASYEIIDLSDTSGLTYSVGKTVSDKQAQAYYNLLLYINDGSHGIHYPKFVKAMLDSTINVLDSLPAFTGFAADQTEGCNSVEVRFTPTIVGAFDTLYWYFGNGDSTITFDSNPIVYTYTTVGQYTVSLKSISLWKADSLQTVIDTIENPDTTLPDIITHDTTYPGYIASSRDSTIFTDYITIDKSPIASFTIDTDTLICRGDTVIFTNTSEHLLEANGWGLRIVDTTITDTTDVIITQTVGNSIPYVFNTLGTFSIIQMVNTDCGIDDTLMTDFITVLDIPTAFFTFTRNAAPDTLTYNFTDLSSSDAVKWDWEFLEDGKSVHSISSDILINPTYTFSDTLKITANAKLTVYNSNGCVHTISSPIFTKPQ